MNTENSEFVQTPSASTDKPPGFFEEFLTCWQTVPYKSFFFALLISWLALFHFIGNSTLGYRSLSTPSLLGWMYTIYDYHGSDDAHGKLIPFAVLALFWWKRKELLAIAPKTWWPALGIIGFALLLHILGFLVQQPRISIVGMFLGMYGLIGLTWGWGWMKASFFSDGAICILYADQWLC